MFGGQDYDRDHDHVYVVPDMVPGTVPGRGYERAERGDSAGRSPRVGQTEEIAIQQEILGGPIGLDQIEPIAHLETGT